MSALLEVRAASGPRRGTQAIHRATTLVRAIAARNRTGLRLVEAVQHSRLERSTARRILKCLIDEGLVVQNDKTRRYFLGPLVFELGLAAAPQFNVVDICRQSLQHLAKETGDTVFLTVRSGHDSVCIDRCEGPFPIRTLTLDVGTRRPLGAGAGGIALLMLLPDEDVDEIVKTNAVRYGAYNNLNVPSLLGMVRDSRERGYAVNDIHITPGASSVGLPVVNRWGHPFAAISVGAILSRMTGERQREIAAILQAEVHVIERTLREAIQP